MNKPISVETLPLGTYGVNYFAGFTSPATEVVNATPNWGLLPAGTKFFMAVDASNLALKSISTPRDVEVTTWCTRGCVYLRMIGGKAIYFSFGIVPGNAWEIGICQNLVEPSTSGGPQLAGDYWSIAQGTYDPPLCVQPGSQPSGIDPITIGVSGHDVYIKRNGVEIWRGQQLYHMAHGQTAFYSQGGDTYGFTDIVVTELPEVQLYSDYTSNIWDVRDWGWKGLKTTGSIAAGSEQLVLDGNPGFAAGDNVIVEIDGEVGEGAVNSMGVGGAWPPLHYPDAATMRADKTQPDATQAYVDVTGAVFVSWGGTWNAKLPGQYFAFKMPKSLIAKVLALSVDGLTLTLDKPAVTSATGANVYYDCTQAYRAVLTDRFGLNFLIPNGVKAPLPAGQYAMADWDLATPATNPPRDGWMCYGQGEDVTSLFTPRGVGVTPLTFNGTNWMVRDFELRHNMNGVDGYMANSVGSPEQHGIVLGGSGSTAQDLRVIDAWAKYFGTAYSAYQMIQRCKGIQSHYWTQYLGWMFQCSDSNNIKFKSCDARCLKGGFAAYESFRGYGNTFEDCYARNGICSNNTSPGNRWVRPVLEFDDGVGDFPMGSGLSPFSPAWQTNDNLGGGTSDACVLENPTIIVHGYTWGNAALVMAGAYGASGNPNMKGLITGINVGDDNCQVIADPPWTSRPKDAPLTGGIYVTEQLYAGWGGQGVRNDTAKNVVVDGFRCVTFGPYDSWSGQINNNGPGAVVKNSVADQIVVNSGNMTQAQWAARQ